MIIHNIKYFFKILLKEKESIFWAFLFPIIIGFFFFLTLSNFQNANFIVPANIAVVSNKVNFENVEEKNKDKEKERLEKNNNILNEKEDTKYDLEKSKTNLGKEIEENIREKIKNENLQNQQNMQNVQSMQNMQMMQNIDKTKIFKESYDKEKIFLNVFSNLAYYEKYIDSDETEVLKNIKQEKEKNKEIEKEFKDFKKDKKEKEKNEEENKKENKENKENEISRIFNIYYVKDEKVAKKIFDEGLVSVILTFENGKINLGFKKTGLYETISKTAVEEIDEKINKIEIMLLDKMDLLEKEIKAEMMQGKMPDEKSIKQKANREVENIIEEIMNAKSNIKEIDEKRPELSDSYYYTLIAMAIMYQSIFMIYLMENIIPNKTVKSARIAISNIRKYKLIISAFIVSIILQFLACTILLLVLKYAFKIDLVLKNTSLILTLLTGNIFSAIFGFFISSILNIRTDNTQYVAIMLTMLGCMFAGMMSHSLKYAIDKNVPIVNKLNPVALIADSIYAVSSNNLTNRLYQNLTILALLGLLFLVLGFIFLNKKRDFNLKD